MKHKTIFSVSGIILLAIGILLFIYKSNDHKECSSLKYTETKNGIVTTHTKHICKEKYSF